MITFLSLVNPCLDVDLLSSWAEHYLRCEFDRYVVGLHWRPGHDRLYEDAWGFFKGLGWEAHRVEGEFRNGALQEKFSSGIKATMERDDTLVLADSDEFHRIHPGDYRLLIDEYEYGEGQFVDRWNRAGGLKAAIPGVPLPVQYPDQGDFQETIYRLFSLNPAFRFKILRSKILFCRARLPVVLCGNHEITGIHDLIPSPSGVKGLLVDHYSWRDTALSRMYTKTYYPPWYINCVLDYFSIAPDDPVRLDYERRRVVVQKSMGWVPANTVLTGRC